MTRAARVLLDILPRLPIAGSPVPLYVRFAEAIRVRISGQLIVPGDPLPSLRQVARHDNVIPVTVANAYQRLAADRLTRARRGRDDASNAKRAARPPRGRCGCLSRWSRPWSSTPDSTH